MHDAGLSTSQSITFSRKVYSRCQGFPLQSLPTKVTLLSHPPFLLFSHLQIALPAVMRDDRGGAQAAGGAFGILFRGGAGGAVDSVIPSLLAGLAGEEPGQALAGLRVILGVRPAALAAMLPKLLKPPLSRSDITALGSLSQVAGLRPPRPQQEAPASSPASHLALRWTDSVTVQSMPPIQMSTSFVPTSRPANPWSRLSTPYLTHSANCNSVLVSACAARSGSAH